ncbi:periplasmic heavy metal sensor [Prosthecobacter sp.]|uniref:periplasmic heavy metal sensor n=1 Tax=Prosthecobacter sp. TaxID=1965333 RepID=UPI002489FF42|nr:periplasmic heavy metal sensor [Prosthecobacter sp.]MDI1314866.1 periplasmic heavy metal sensor [Prosthecobacter sp.]
MKRGLFILLLALTASAGAFFITRNQCQCGTSLSASVHDGDTMLPELVWLHDELKLDDAQFARVKELHLAYRPTCEALCMKVMTSRRKLGQLAAVGNLSSPELDAALQEQAALNVECQRALLKHLQQTAAVMSTAQARQYLDAMLPQAIGVAAEPVRHGHSHIAKP